MKRKTTEDQLIARLWFLVCVLAAAIVISLFIAAIIDVIRNLRPAEMPEEHTQVVVEDVPLAGAAAIAESVEVGGWEEYVEGEGPAPAWYRPDEPMAAVWSAEDINVPCNELATNLQSDTVDYNTRRDIGCPDWNLDTTLWGWDGHTAEVWEMDLFSRIVFLEFGISSQECREAGIDAILRLWESEYYSSTLFGTVSAVTENGKPAFSTYPGVWEEEYDYEKLAQIRKDCEKRFVNGPVWVAPFFRLEYYHDWAQPCYEIDGVYFSTFKEGVR